MKKDRRIAPTVFVFGSSNRTRTCGPLINSQLLYQLSYRGLGRKVYPAFAGVQMGILGFPGFWWLGRGLEFWG